MFYLQHEPSGQLAHALATGEHDAAKTNRCEDAKAFDTRAEAYEFSQNFGDEWNVLEL